MKLVGLSGSLTPRSKTLIAIEKAIEFAADHQPSIETEIINLRDYDVQFCDGRNPADYEGDTAEVIQKIEDADALIIGTPIYRGTYTGALKNVLDLIPNDALRGKVVSFVATGGTYHHYLAIEHELKPLAGYFRAHIVPGSVYAHNDHFSNKTLVDPEVISRLQQLGEDTVNLHQLIGKEHTGANGPNIPRKSLTYTG